MKQKIIISDHHYNVILIILDTILSMIQGKCIDNKNKVLQSSLLENFSDLIKLNENTIVTRQSKIVNKDFKDVGWYIMNEGYLSPDQLLKIKNFCFEITEHLVENDTLGINRKKLVRTLDFDSLVLNMNTIF